MALEHNQAQYRNAGIRVGVFLDEGVGDVVLRARM